MQTKQLHQLALSAINQGDFQKAQQALIQLLNSEPKFADGYFLLGVIEAELGTFSKATKLMQRASELQPMAEYFAHLAKCYAMMGNSNATYETIERAKSFELSDALTLDTIGVSLSRLGDHQQAIEFFQAAIAKKRTAPFYYNLGSSQTFLGHFEQARASYESAIELEPLFYQAHSSLSHLGGISAESNHVKRLKAVFDKMPHPDAKLHISHALARELEALGHYDEAYKYLSEAKVSKKAKLAYDFNQDKKLFAGLKRLFSGSLPSASECSNSSAIFVTGMPRSGTTLVERILTNGSGVKAVGELQEMGLAVKTVAQTPGRYILDEATINALNNASMAKIGQVYLDSIKSLIEPNERFVDKMPLNVLYGGLIATALPNAKQVCVIRNPMDTIWGNYKQLFSLNDPYYNYAYDQITIAKYYIEFVRLAEHWQNLFPNQFKIIYYDDLVQEPEKWGEALLEFCNIEFQPSMLNIENNTSAVATASSVQVRSAINTKSLGQWRRFEEHLQPALSIILEAGLKVN